VSVEASDGSRRPSPWEDHGVGIPSADQGRIFERFYKVDRVRVRGGGTGLGLAIARHVIEQHGGRITVVSEEGRGSTFTVSLPAAPGAGQGGLIERPPARPRLSGDPPDASHTAAHGRPPCRDVEQSANLADRWDERLPLILADMAALQPDALGLQEVVYVLQQDRLIGAAGEGRYESSRGWAGRPEYGNALLVKEPLVAEDPERLDLGLTRSAIRARVVLPGGASAVGRRLPPPPT